jgi:hypothetical protein
MGPAFAPDGDADVVVVAHVDVSGGVVNLYLNQKGTSRVWDTVVKGPVDLDIPGLRVSAAGRETPQLGVAEDGRWINAANGELPAALEGAHSLELYCSGCDPRAKMQVIAERPSGQLEIIPTDQD